MGIILIIIIFSQGHAPDEIEGIRFARMETCIEVRDIVTKEIHRVKAFCIDETFIHK